MALREQRRARGWSQQDVADAMSELGFSWQQTTAAKSEAAERPVPLDEAAALAALLGTSVDALLAEDPNGRTDLIADLVWTRSRLDRLEQEAAQSAQRLEEARTAYEAARDAYEAWQGVS